MTIEGNFTRLFNTVAEYNEARSNNYNEPWVSYTIENSGVSFNKTMYEKILSTPLTFKIISAGTINWVTNATSFTKTIEYKLNDGEWTSITSNTGASAPSVSVNSGDIVQFRGDNATYGSNNYYSTFSGSTAKFEAECNIMSLIDSTGFATATTLASRYTFRSLFSNCTGLTSAENLLLPAKILVTQCYAYMFDNCTSLTVAPSVLPATRCSTYSCVYMFQNCTSLITAPELPATTLDTQCYGCMFWNCTSLTKAPYILPATTLTPYCYTLMFYGCTSLTTAPVLPATTLVNSCYRAMFNGCTRLNYIKCLATDISANDCTIYWTINVTSSGTFVKNPNMTGWTTGNNGIPSNWTVQDA